VQGSGAVNEIGTFHSRRAAARLEKGLGELRFGKYLKERAGADSGEKHNQVELPGDQSAGKLQHAIGFREGNFTHGGCRIGLSAIGFDEPSHFDRAATFEREHFQSKKTW